MRRKEDAQRRRRRRTCHLSILLLVSLLVRVQRIPPLQVAALAGTGFGSGRPGSKNKKRKKKKTADWLKQEKQPVESSSSSSSTEKLDAWGLPLPTTDELFPPPPPDTITPASSTRPYTRDDWVRLLKGYPFRVPSILSPQMQLVHEDPPVIVIDDFLSTNDCQELEQLTTTTDTTATIKVASPVHPQSISRRTSTSWFCRYDAVPTLVQQIVRWTGQEAGTLEEPQIVQYQAGQEFSWHYDVLPESTNPRVATILVYLSDTGGDTAFRDLQQQQEQQQQSAATVHGNQQQPLTVSPQKGRALVFFPTTMDGQDDERLLHAGLPCDSQNKLLVQVWCHATKYRATLPDRTNRQENV